LGASWGAGGGALLFIRDCDELTVEMLDALRCWGCHGEGYEGHHGACDGIHGDGLKVSLRGYETLCELVATCDSRYI
jgi:hypothetical protein